MDADAQWLLPQSATSTGESTCTRGHDAHGDGENGGDNRCDSDSDSDSDEAMLNASPGDDDDQMGRPQQGGLQWRAPTTRALPALQRGNGRAPDTPATNSEEGSTRAREADDVTGRTPAVVLDMHKYCAQVEALALIANAPISSAHGLKGREWRDQHPRHDERNQLGRRLATNKAKVNEDDGNDDDDDDDQDVAVDVDADEERWLQAMVDNVPVSSVTTTTTRDAAQLRKQPRKDDKGEALPVAVQHALVPSDMDWEDYHVQVGDSGTVKPEDDPVWLQLRNELARFSSNQ